MTIGAAAPGELPGELFTAYAEIHGFREFREFVILVYGIIALPLLC